MKIIHLGIILAFVLFTISYEKPVTADSSEPVKILGMHVLPDTIKVNDTFSIEITILNNSTYPIYLTSGSCTPAFSVEFDSHAKQVYPNIACTTEAILQKVDPQSQVTVSNEHKPGVIYQAIQSGTATANITLSYFAKNQTATDYSNIDYSTSKSFQFQIHNVNSDSSGPPIPLPRKILPLQQFRSGITANHIICKKDLYVILKAENSFPACVSIETGKKLVLRGWATTFGTNISTDYWSTCDKPFPKSDSGTVVLYMPTNSIGKICLSYSNYNNESESVNPPGISDPNNSYQKPKDITIWTYTPISTISNVNGTTVAYFIKTGNQTGFYGLSLPSCGMIPFAVGYDNDSKIIPSDFPFLGVAVSCPPGMLYPNFDGIEGIGVKYIP